MSAADREFLLRSLADLEREREAGDLSDTDYADLRARYEAKLATLDASVSTRPQETAAASTQKRGVGRTGRIVATVVVVAVIGIGGGLAVAAWSGSREPGENITGSSPPSGSEQQLAEAAALVGAGKASEAIEIYQSVLDENPEDVTALTYFGWLLRNVGVQQEDERLSESGVRFIEKATELDPEFSEAWFFRGIIYLRDEKDHEKAVDALRLALANEPLPEVESAARELLAEIAQSS